LTISVFDNILTGNPCGIHVLRSFSNNICRNTIKANGDSGITLNESSTNSISENNITQNPTGTRVDKSLGNQIYHNSYVANAQDVNITVPGYANFWDDGYPSGGNYWSKHPITDSYRGIHQNETGCDGICDCNCTLDVDNADRYPLHKPYAGPHDLGIEDALSSKTLIPQNPHSGCPKNCTCTWWTNVTTSLVLVNYGIQEESFQFFFYINGTIQTIFSETLEARTSTTLTSVLNTTNWSKGTYVLQTFVLGDLGETDLTDNYCELKIYVLVPGDVRFPIPIVDMTDLYYLALNYAKTAPYLTPLEANLDINSDGIINMLDLYIAALHFGQK
jgi:parallel beta-helix repeat protein